MDVAPAFVLPPRPQPPAADTKEHEMWCRMQSVNYNGGSITTAYGNIVQTWGPGETPQVCIGTDVNRASYSAKRTNKIGGETKTVNVSAKTYKKYPKRTSAGAAGGEPFTFVTRDGIFTARVSGDIQSLVQYLCSVRMQQYQEFTVWSSTGAKYGPFTPLTILS